MNRLSQADQLQVDRLCDEFESAIRTNETPTIEDFLTRIGDDAIRRTALKELIGLELYHTQSGRMDLTCDSYQQRFPDDCESVNAAFHEAATLFSPGTEIGPFRIERRLGEGGMGIVYVARDEKLEREVALKVLTAEFAEDNKRLAQFQREAIILAKLNHPHIATLYGFEEIAGLHICVMEFVPGRTLDEILHERGCLTQEEATRMFKQFAAGLEYAHERGVVHRDLKPSNIAIDPSGQVKLLDFGLAIHDVQHLAVGVDSTEPVTAETVALAGTVPYMSPEQINHGLIDKRSDIWAFGCCLYESLSGKRAFGGDTTREITKAIADRHPDWTALSPDTPRSTRFLLERCLQKDPNRRLRDVGDAWLDDDYLDGVLKVNGESSSVESKAVTNRLARWALLVALGGIVTAAATFAFRSQEADALKPARWLTLNIPADQAIALADRALLSEGRPSIAVTPEGNRLVYVSAVDGVPKLCVRRLDSPPGNGRVSILEGTDGAFNPFISPDGQWIGYLTERALWKVSISGSKPVWLCDVETAYGATWTSDRQIYIAEAMGYRVTRVSDQGGNKDLVVEDSLANSYIWPEALPDGKGVLVYQERSGILQISPTGEQHLVHDRGRHARYVPSGHLLYAEFGRLMAVPFDIERMEVTGDAVPVLDHVRTESRGAAQFATDDDGTLYYIPGGHASFSKLVTVPVDPEQSALDEEQSLDFRQDVYGTFELSPEGRRLAIVIWTEKRDIWVFDLDRQTRTQLTFVGDNRTPLWTPDGRSVVFSSNRDGSMNLYRVRVDKPGSVERLTQSADHHFSSHWFQQDGRHWLAFVRRQGPPHGMLSLDPTTEQDLPSSQLAGQISMLSPDGSWYAYGRNNEVWISRHLRPGNAMQITTDGGEEAVWSPESDQVYYRNARKWMAVDVETEPGLDAGQPTLLFESDFLNVNDRSYDITADGRYFILLRGAEPSTPTSLTVGVNFYDELKRIAP